MDVIIDCFMLYLGNKKFLFFEGNMILKLSLIVIVIFVYKMNVFAFLSNKRRVLLIIY